MRTLLVAIFLIVPNLSFSQIHKVSGLSDRFDFEIEVSNTSDKYFTAEKVRVFLKQRHQLLLEIPIESIAFETGEYLQSHDVIARLEQDLILLRDFNFDGKKDLAILQFYSSKGPSYTVYLYNGTDFVRSEPFSEIIQKSQGKFDLLPDYKEINIIGTGGCCYHVYSTYKVIDGYPFEDHTIISEQDTPFDIETERKWTTNGYVETIRKTADFEQEGIYPMLRFKLDNKDKTVVIYNINDRMLYYVLIKGKNEVEFSYPIEAVYKQKDFTMSHDFQSLSFVNASANYKIYEYDDKVGVIVKVDGKSYDLKGEIGSKEGSLTKIAVPTLDNVYMEY